MCIEISRLFLPPTTRLLTVEGENILEIQRGRSTLTTSTPISQRNNTTLCFKQNHKQTQASRGRGKAWYFGNILEYWWLPIFWDLFSINNKQVWQFFKILHFWGFAAQKTMLDFQKFSYLLMVYITGCRILWRKDKTTPWLYSELFQSHSPLF